MKFQFIFLFLTGVQLICGCSRKTEKHLQQEIVTNGKVAIEKPEPLNNVEQETGSLETVSLPDITLKSPLDDNSFNSCAFPTSLKKAVEKQLGTPCAFIASEHLTQIKKLRIEDIDEIETELLNEQYAVYFTSLEELDISNNPRMRTLPDIVTHIFTLRTLDISGTGINDLSEDICRLKHLTTLRAAYNNYKQQEVPFGIFCLNKLKVLDMSYSFIRYIDEYIYKMESLEELYLNNNDLTTVPFVLHTMSNILLVDLTHNMFEPLPWYVSLFGYKTLNTLHNCKWVEHDSRSRKLCQEDMLSDFKCEWWYKLQFKRGKPFRQYKEYEEMTSAERESFELARGQPSKNRCYSFWLNNTFIPLSDNEKEKFMEQTINGKTIREWKVVFSIREKSSWAEKFGFSLCEQRILYADTSYLPDSQEIFPERYHSPDWIETPVECAEDETTPSADDNGIAM